MAPLHRELWASQLLETIVTHLLLSGRVRYVTIKVVPDSFVSSSLRVSPSFSTTSDSRDLGLRDQISDHRNEHT